MESKCTVFIVDDDPDDVEILTTTFQKVGFKGRLQSFGTGNALLKAMDCLPVSALPRLVILDHQLPGVTGSDTVASLRSESKYDSVYIVVYSTSIAPAKAKSLQEQGASLCLLKGNNITEITNHVRQFCILAGKGEESFE